MYLAAMFFGNYLPVFIVTIRNTIKGCGLEAKRYALLVFNDSLTRSLNSLPGLKCGTYFPGRETESPVLGLRPALGGLK